MRKLAILLLLTLLFPLCGATIYINEIEPDPTDQCSDCTEWVELYNSGNENVDVANWTLKDKKDRYMYIKAEYTEDGSTEIPAGGYIVIYPGKEGLYRNIYLTNSEDTIRLFDGDTKIDETTYSFSKDYDVAWARTSDGGDSWEKTEPTRGESNGEEDPPEEEDDEDDVDDEEEDTDDSDDVEDEDDVDNNNDASDTIEEVEEEEPEQKITGKTVFVSDQKQSLTKPLLLLLCGLLVIVAALQMQLMSRK